MKGAADFNHNNLDCLRLLLASIVVLQHLSALTNFPAYTPFDHFPGFFAVRAFFVISGLLIYRSYTRCSSLRSYFDKRMRRILPAYVTIVVLCAFAFCPLSVLPAAQYFGLGWWKYLTVNLTFLNFLQPWLPGVFTANEMPSVNGALWTLKIEVAFYLLVPVLHVLFVRLGTKKVIAAVIALSYAWKYAFLWLVAMDHSGQHYRSGSHSFYYEMSVQFPAQLAYFCAGILLLLYFDQLKQYMLPIAVATVVCYGLDQSLLHGALDILWISGLVLVFGFWRHFGNFSKYGDFSYGVYIVHFPILQTMVALGFRQYGPTAFFAATVLLVFCGSFLMWHLVEKRFLARSSHYRVAA